MGRFVNPGSLRYGSLNKWQEVSENSLNFWKSKVFLDYLKNILNKYMVLEEGIVYGDIKINYEQKSVNISISIYDRDLELVLRDGYGNKQNLELILQQNILRKLDYLKSLIKKSGNAYFKVPIEVTFIGLSLKSVSAEILSKYIKLMLEKGFSLQEILRLITREFSNSKNSLNKKNIYSLPHRMTLNYLDDQKMFSPYFIGDKKLLGYRIDCLGRFTRKQRASKKSVKEGTVSLGGFKGFLDYGFSTGILEYGTCGIKVWLYYESMGLKAPYLFKY